MAYNPKQPRNQDGEWTNGGGGSFKTIQGGKASGHNAGGGNRKIAAKIAKQHTPGFGEVLNSAAFQHAIHSPKPFTPSEVNQRLTAARSQAFKIMKSLSSDKNSEHYGKSDAELRLVAARSYPNSMFKKRPDGNYD